MAAPNRDGWRAAIIGVSRYADPRLHDIPAASANVADLARALTAPGGAFAEDHCLVLTDPEESTQVGKAIATAAQNARDVLLVYYAGHGLVARDGTLYLALPGTDDDHREWSSVPITTLRDAMRRSRARTRVLILDCCFSGRAFEAMSGSAAAIDGQIDIQGTYTITSSSRDQTSQAPEGQRHTAFTGALLSAASDTSLTLDQLFWRIDEILHRNSQPRPQRRNVNVAGELRLFTAPDAQPDPPTDASLVPDTGADCETLLKSGRRSADQGDLDLAEGSWRRAAAQGHVGAMNNLANLLVTRRRFTEAHDWYRKAAKLGSREAMVNLANLLYKAKSFGDAEHFWRLAGEVGHTDAMHNLAVMLDKSFHFDEALTWYQRAAEAGHTDAMHNLAIRLHYRGQISEATAWWHSAGHKRAQRTSDKPRGPVLRTHSC
ncbi:caspase, EACC1-associated type [Nocardia rhamnosiphila]